MVDTGNGQKTPGGGMVPRGGLSCNKQTTRRMRYAAAVLQTIPFSALSLGTLTLRHSARRLNIRSYSMKAGQTYDAFDEVRTYDGTMPEKECETLRLDARVTKGGKGAEREQATIRG